MVLFSIRNKFITARNVIFILILLYAVGIVGFILPQTRDFFLVLTKWVLLLNFLLLIRYHKSDLNNSILIAYLLVFIGSFFIELIGVNSGLIFGNYYYGSGLGYKIINTPILIGINWLMLSYSFMIVFQKLTTSLHLSAILGAAGMLLYDIILEQSAPMLDMWYWVDNEIPLKNYLAWFVIAYVIQLVLLKSRVRVENKLALPTLLCQGLFFLILGIYKLTGL